MLSPFNQTTFPPYFTTVNDTSIEVDWVTMTKLFFIDTGERLGLLPTSQLGVMRTILWLALLLITLPTLCAANGVGVDIVDVDEAWTTVHVRWVADSASDYAQESYTDTIFCAAICDAVWKRAGVVVPMTRLNATTWECHVSLPDSTYDVRIEIVRPTDRVPNGIVSFRRETFDDMVHAAIDDLEDPNQLAALDRIIDSLALVSTYDPILNRAQLWNSYLYPSMQDAGFGIDKNRVLRLLPLAIKHPRTAMAETLIQRIGSTKDYNADSLLKVITHWRNSWDVDLLMSVGRLMSLQESPMYDPKDALWFLTRAEQSAVTERGFRTGDNIYSSMGRLDMIVAAKVKALHLVGLADSAISIGLAQLRVAENQFGREQLVRQLAPIAQERGDTTLLHLLDSLRKPVMHDFEYTLLDGTKGRLSDHRGKLVVLDFWFVGCAGCLAEHKELNALADKLSVRDDVVLLSVALNDEKTLEWYLKKHPLAFSVVPNGEELCNSIGITAYPTHVVIDRAGQTLLWETGGSTVAVETLRMTVYQALGKN
jgi:peroxiredoxin